MMHAHHKTIDNPNNQERNYALWFREKAHMEMHRNTKNSTADIWQYCIRQNTEKCWRNNAHNQSLKIFFGKTTKCYNRSRCSKNNMHKMKAMKKRLTAFFNNGRIKTYRKN